MAAPVKRGPLPPPVMPARARVIHRFSPSIRLPVAVFLVSLPALVPGLAWVSGLLLAALAVAAGVDLATSKYGVDAVRKPGPVLSLGAENRVMVEVRASAAVELELKDDLPLHFERVGDWPKVTLKPGEWAEAEYRVSPMRRGQYILGPLHARYHSKLGLWVRRVSFPLAEPVRVYPNLLAARQYEIAMRRGRTLEGLKRARMRGQGTEFESLREYQEGDQYRSINWAASARTGHLVTNLYQTDRSQPIMLVLDAGRMMIPQVKGLAKLDHALNAALLLATVAAERGDQIGMMVFGGEVKSFVPPRKGRGQVMALVESLYALAPEQVEPDYSRMVGWLRAKHKKRSLVVFFTDLMDPEINRGLINHLSALAAHHMVMLVSLSDPELLRVSHLKPQDSREVYQKASALEVLAQRAETRARLQSRGVLVIDVPPEEFSAAVVNQYLLIKEQGKL